MAGVVQPGKKMARMNLILGSKLKREVIKQRLDWLLLLYKTTSEDEIYLSQKKTTPSKGDPMLCNLRSEVSCKVFLLTR